MSSEVKADSIPTERRLGQKQDDSRCLRLVILTSKTRRQMLGDCVPTKKLRKALHVGLAHVNSLLSVEGPRESPDEGNPNGDCLHREELVVDPHVV